jgi:hypothetical protein
MAAKTTYVQCPAEGCEEIRNEFTLAKHLLKAHGIQPAKAVV